MKDAEYKILKTVFIVYFLLLGLVACSPTKDVIDLLGTHESNNFKAERIFSEPFILTSYERVNAKSSIANIYIEGDGLAWLSKSRPSLDPTPKNPVALKLAIRDNANNVIYLARPCQYSKLLSKGACPQKYWTSHRFSPEVIEAMGNALSDIKERHKITGFNLIGYSGGGNIAGLLAARRDDVLSLRTVAGNLDHKMQSEIHDVALMPESLNIKDIAFSINGVPQIHFSGSEDRVVPVEIVQSYIASAVTGNPSCIKSEELQGVSHHKGWEEAWEMLLKEPLPSCNYRR